MGSFSGSLARPTATLSATITCGRDSAPQVGQTSAPREATERGRVRSKPTGFPLPPWPWPRSTVHTAADPATFGTALVKMGLESVGVSRAPLRPEPLL